MDNQQILRKINQEDKFWINRKQDKCFEFLFPQIFQFQLDYKQLNLKIMQGKHCISPLGYPNLIFNNKIIKTSSLRHIKHQNKQNLITFQSTKRIQPHLSTNNQNSSLAVNVYRNFDSKSKAPLASLQFQTNSQMQKSSPRKNLLNSVQSNNSRASIKSGRNKSVKFNEVNIEMPSMQSSLNLQKQMTRKKSGSILKSNRIRPVSNSQDLKSKSLLKYEQNNKMCNIFTIIEYKNTLVREKYNQLLRTFNKNQENCLKMNMNQKTYLHKYTDTNFPPTSPSVSKTRLKSEIRWVRLSQLYSDKNIVLFKNNQTISNISAQQYGNNQFATALKLISQSKILLNRIFQNSSFNQMGMYLLKIFYQHQWRCVMVDDYIPISKQGNGCPNFLFTSINSQEKEVQIWPLIFEKAYASVMGNYQKLHNCDLMSYLVQMIGLPMSKLQIGPKVDLKKETQILEHSDIIFALNKQQGSNQLLKLINLGKSQKNQRINLKELRDYNQIYYINTSSLQHSVKMNIGTLFSIGKKIKSKRFFKQTAWQNDFIRQKSIIKSFVLPSSDQIQFLLKFKQNIDKSQKQSFWLRTILLMKQYDGYRWIDGKYCQDYISFSSYLQAGEYYLIILPDWTQTYEKELFLITYSRINKIELKNYMQRDQQKIIEKGCTDYAQRKGKLIQINKYICAYTIVDQEAGLIIQNINNERRSGPIKIFRNIQNLKPKESYLLPYNKEFYKNNNSINYQISVSVQKEESYSVILMHFGGNDQKFMQSFSFGP